MKKIFIYGMMAVLAFGLAACSNEEAPAEEAVVSSSHDYRTVSVRLNPSSSTRVVLEEGDLYWNANDEIGIFFSEQNEIKQHRYIFHKISVFEQTYLFTLAEDEELSDDAALLFSYYPYSEYAKSEDGKTVTNLSVKTDDIPMYGEYDTDNSVVNMIPCPVLTLTLKYLISEYTKVELLSDNSTDGFFGAYTLGKDEFKNDGKERSVAFELDGEEEATLRLPLTTNRDYSDLKVNVYSGEDIANSYTLGAEDTKLKAVSGTIYSKTIKMPVYDIITDRADARRLDYALEDGTFMRMRKKDYIPELKVAEKEKIIGLVYWTTCDNGTENPAAFNPDKILKKHYPDCNHGLVVSLTEVNNGTAYNTKQYEGASFYWQDTTSDVYKYQQSDDFVDEDKSLYPAIQINLDAGKTEDFRGYGATEFLIKFNYNLSEEDKKYTVLPASKIVSYRETHATPNGFTPWYIPSVHEYMIFANRDYSNNKDGAYPLRDESNAYLSNLKMNNVEPVNCAFWLPFQANSGEAIYADGYDDGSFHYKPSFGAYRNGCGNVTKREGRCLRPICAF